MCFPASADEKEALKTQLDGIKIELQELEQNVSSDQSEAWAWGSIALVGLTTSDVSGITLEHMIECGGLEALALAASKCYFRDMPVILDAIHLLVMSVASPYGNALRSSYSTASVESLTSMRIMLGPVLHILSTLADDRRIALNSFSVLQVLTTDPQSHVVVQENLSAVFGGLSRHEGDEAIQMLGLQVVSNLVEDGTFYDYGKDSDMEMVQIEKKLFYEKVFPAGWKVRLGQSGAVVAAVRALRSFRGQQLLQSIAARNLWKLAQAAPENRRLILQEGGIPATIDAMLSHLPVDTEPSPRGLLESLFKGVACVSIEPGVQWNPTPAVFSRASQIEVLSNGVQVFWKMAWNEPDIQQQIIEQGGLSAIIRTMAALQGEASVQTLACGALLAILRTHNDFNRNAVLRSEGLTAVHFAAHCHKSSSGVQWMCAPVEALLTPPKPQPTQSTPTSAINLPLTSAVQQTACLRPGLLTKPYLSQAAIEYHTQSLAIAKEVGDRAGEGRAFANLGDAYQMLGDVDKAIKYRTLAKEVGDRAGQDMAYANLRNLPHGQRAAYQLLIVEHRTQQLKIAQECLVENRELDDALCREMDAIEQVRNEATALFRKLDKNQDRALQVGEMLDPVATLDRERSEKFNLNMFMALMDTDGDEKITQGELRAHRHASQSDSRGQDSVSEELDHDDDESIAGGSLSSASFFFSLHLSHGSTGKSLRGKRGIVCVCVCVCGMNPAHEWAHSHVRSVCVQRSSTK
jgi:hypothetical protein